MPMDFSPNLARVNIADAPSLAPTPAMSWSAFIEVFGGAVFGLGTIFSKTNPVIGASDFGYFWAVNGTTSPLLLGIQITGVIANFNSTISLPLNQRIHVATVWDGSTVQHYIDGVPAGSSPAVGVPNNPAGGATIGEREDIALLGFDVGINGAVEDMRFYQRALSFDEVLTIKNTDGTDGIVRGLGGRWLLRGQGGTTPVSVTDYGPNGNTGTPAASPVYTAGGAARAARRLA